MTVNTHDIIQILLLVINAFGAIKLKRNNNINIFVRFFELTLVLYIIIKLEINPELIF